MEIRITKDKKINLNRLLLNTIENSKPVLFGLMIIVLALVFWFIYNNVYIPLTRAVEIAELKETTSVVRPDQGMLDEALKRQQIRSTLQNIEWQNLRNPFIAAPIKAPSPNPSDSADESIDTTP